MQHASCTLTLAANVQVWDEAVAAVKEVGLQVKKSVQSTVVLAI
jgi:hypothetical protein